LLQTLLKEMRTVRHVIYMDHMEEGKKMDKEDFPNNVQIHAMSSVQQLGALPVNRTYRGLTSLHSSASLLNNNNCNPSTVPISLYISQLCIF